MPVSVKAATWLAALRATIPVGFTQGALQVTSKFAPPAMGAIGSLKAAVMVGVFVDTLVSRSAGVTAVTVGAKPAIPLAPKIGCRPAPPHPAASVLSSAAMSHLTHVKFLSDLLMR
jgi:hypothetical protein